MRRLKNTRVLVLGFDGADWELIFNWAKEEKLPNFRKLIEQGVFGPLESTIPPVTPPAWTSMVTGKKPGKHGIYSFIKVEKTKDGWKKLMYTSKDKKSRELWDYIEKSIVVNVPFTYPPKKINGILITGMLTPSLDSEFAYPPEFKNEILKKFPNYTFELEPAQYSTRTREFVEKLYEMTNERIKLFWYLFEKSWNLMFFVFIGPDRIQHILWGTNEMEEYWKYLDNFLGDVIEKVESKGDITLFVVSDHGFRKTNRIIYINNLLIKEGYLKPRKQGNRLENSIVGKCMFRIIPRVLPIYKRLPNSLKIIIKKTARPWTPPDLFEDFDLDNSKAFFISYSGLGGLLYINRKFSPEKTKKELKELLENLRDPETDENVIEKIYEAEKIYPGFAINEPFEVLVILPKEGYTTYQNISPSKIITNPNIEKANHRLYGIFFGYGPGIKKGQRIYAKIYDIAPTILHLFGLPIPNDMDGRVLMEIFEEDSEFAKREPKYVDPSYYEKKQENVKLKKAIKSLKLKGKL